MKRSTGKTSALGILVFSHFFRLRFAGMHVRAIELSSVVGSSMHFVSTIFTTIGYGGVTPATLGIFCPFRPQTTKDESSHSLYLLIDNTQGASSWPSWWSSLSFPSSYIASALQHLTSTIWSTGLPKTHHSFPSLCQTISNRDTDVLILNFCCTE